MKTWSVTRHKVTQAHTTQRQRAKTENKDTDKLISQAAQDYSSISVAFWKLRKSAAIPYVSIDLIRYIWVKVKIIDFYFHKTFQTEQRHKHKYDFENGLIHFSVVFTRWPTVAALLLWNREMLLVGCSFSNLLILDFGTGWGEWSASRPGRALAPGRDPLYPLDRRLRGPQGQSGHTG
jgi:hypothetical protein